MMEPDAIEIANRWRQSESNYLRAGAARLVSGAPLYLVAVDLAESLARERDRLVVDLTRMHALHGHPRWTVR